MMEVMRTLEKQIDDITQRLEDLTAGHQDILDRLDEVPGIDKNRRNQLLVKLVLPLMNLFVQLRLHLGRVYVREIMKVLAKERVAELLYEVIHSKLY